MKNISFALLLLGLLFSIKLEGQCSCFEFQVTPNPDSACLFDVRVIRFASCGAASPINQVTITLTDTVSEITATQPAPGVVVGLNGLQTQAVFTTDFNLESLTLNNPRLIGSFKLTSFDQTSTLSGMISGAAPVGTVCTFSNLQLNVPCLRTIRPTFQKLYGNADDNFPTKVKGYNGFTYILSTRRTPNGDFAVFSKFSNAGVFQWEYQLDIQSQLLDFEGVPTTPTSIPSFLLVGRTEPTNIGGVLQDNQSLLVKIQDNGPNATLVFSRKYDHTGRESFNRIIRHTNALPVGTPFEYYILGNKNINLPANSTDQPMLYNINSAGGLRSPFPREYVYQFELEGHLGMFQRSNGNVVILGDAAPTNDGILIEINGTTGAVVSANKYNNTNNTAQYDFWDGMELPNNQIVIGGTDFVANNDKGVLLTLSNTYTPLYGMLFNNISEIHEIGRDPNGSTLSEFLYVIGPAKQTPDYPVIAQVATDFTSFSVNWAKSLHDLEPDFKSPHFSVTPTFPRLFFADSRMVPTPNNWDMLIGAFDLNLGLVNDPHPPCRFPFPMTTTPFLPLRTTIPVVDKALNQSISDMGILVQPGLTCTTFCSPCTAQIVCNAPANITVNTDPGKCSAAVPLAVSGTGCGPMSIFLNATGATVFTDSDFSPVGSISLSGTYTFNKGVTNLTVTVTDGLNNTKVCPFTVTVIDNEPPKIICPPNVSVMNVPLCNGGAIATFPQPTVTDNCPMVTYVCSAQSGSFFPCGQTVVTCKATDMAPALNMSTCTFTVNISCVCATIGQTTIVCDPVVDDKYLFTIPVTSLSNGVGCTATVTGTSQTGVTVVSNGPIVINPSGVLSGMITVTGGVIPTTFNLTVTVQCICPTGPITCTLPVSLIPICCKNISLLNKSVCATDDQVLIPLIGCGQFLQLQLVNWYVATGPTCPPFPGLTPPPGSGWLLQQGSFDCSPLLLTPSLYTDNIWVKAVITVGDYPCSVIPSNIVCVTLCKPVSCNIAPPNNYQEYCFTGSPITAMPLMAVPTAPNSITCPASITAWSVNGIPTGQSGSNYTPTGLTLPVGFTPCYKDFTYTATVTSLCGDQTCSATVRLFNNAASIGTLTMNPNEIQPFCPGEDATLEFVPTCASHPPAPAMWTWCVSTTSATTGFTPQPGWGNMNPLWNTNQLFVDHWYQVKSQNGICPQKQETYFIDVRDPFSIGTFTATTVMTPPDCYVTGVDLAVPFLPNPADPLCPIKVTWIKDGQVLFSSTYTTSPATWFYTDPTLLGDYSGNYWVIAERTCCHEKIKSNLVTIDPPCYTLLTGPCYLKQGGTATLTGQIVNPTPFVICTTQWFYLLADGTLSAIGTSNVNTITVTNDGYYIFKVFCDNGCIKCDTFPLDLCYTDCTDLTTEVINNPFSISVFPNPTTGDLNVQLPVPATDNLRFRTTGVTGQVLREQGTQSGNALQTLSTGDLPPGLYFLQVVLEGRVIAVEKFIKQ